MSPNAELGFWQGKRRCLPPLLLMISETQNEDQHDDIAELTRDQAHNGVTVQN